MEYNFIAGHREASVQVRTIQKMGHLEAVLALNAAASSFTPELVILVGLAGSMDPNEIGLGDVVVSNQVKTYSANKVGTISQDPSERPQYQFFTVPPTMAVKDCIIVDDRDRMQGYSYLRYDREFVESSHVDTALSALEGTITGLELKQVPMDVVPKNFAAYPSMKRDRSVHYGWLFGSHYVIDSKEYRNYVTEKNTSTEFDIYSQMKERTAVHWPPGKLLAVDMESYGVLKAVETLRTLPRISGGSEVLVGGIVVRGISDLSEAKAATERESKNALRKIAVQNAAEVAAQIVERLDYSHIVRR